MYIFSSHFRFRNFGWILMIAMLGFGWLGVHQTLAQPADVTIDLVQVTNRGSNSAVIAISTTPATVVRVKYGQTSGYGSTYPADGSFVAIESTSHSLTIAGLQPSTTYHFQVEAKKDNTTVRSSDRTFTTSSGTVTGSGLLITDILADCTNVRCRIRYSTTSAANVQLRWDTANRGSFENYRNLVTEQGSAFTSGQRSLLVEDASFPSNPGGVYHYILRARDSAGPAAQEFTTGNLTFQLSENGVDHTFTTGQCSDGTVIGGCSASGAYCRPGGILEFNCASICQFSCGARQTCSAGGICLADPGLTGSAGQCNRTECFDGSGRLKNPAPAGCYQSWPKCNANTILKVRKDRGCNLWLSCSTSVTTQASVRGPAEQLCLSLAACNSLSQDGQCNKYLPQGQCDNNPLRFCSRDADCEAGGSCILSPSSEPTRALQDLTFESAKNISHIANLSGNVVAGIDWAELGGSTVLQGYLPWQLMRQIGGNSQIENGDFEAYGLSPKPWEAVPLDVPDIYQSTFKIEYEDKSFSHNHVLTVTPQPTFPNIGGNGRCSNDPSEICGTGDPCTGGATCSVPAGKCLNSSNAEITCTRNNQSACKAGSPCTYPDLQFDFSGVATKSFTAVPSEFYYGEVRVRATGNGAAPKLRVQFGFNNYASFSLNGRPTSVDVQTTQAWQRIGLGPITGMGGETRFAIVCADQASCKGSQFQIDDIQVRPVLQINTSPNYVTPSCRLYPREDAPACDYIDANGVTFKGWRGYCLEHDSQTGTCLSWWPVDIIKGETSIFGADTPAGYSDQAPLFYCTQAKGNANLGNAGFSSSPYVVAANSHFSGVDGVPGVAGDCDELAEPTDKWTFSVCDDNNSPTFTYAPNGADAQLNKNEIEYVEIKKVGEREWPNLLRFINTPGFLEREELASNRTYRYYQEPGSNGSTWWRAVPADGCTPGGDSCLFFGLQFSASGQFINYQFASNDQAGNTEGTLYQVLFHVREICTQIVQVVDPTGKNQAFASRINSDAYRVPTINMSRTGSDLTPYGALLPPATGGDDPENWPLLSVEKPNYTRPEIPVPGQYRAGTPYACNKDCSALVCNLDPSNSCTPDRVQQCQSGNNTDFDQDGFGDGQCIGVGNSSASNKGSQSFSPSVNPNSLSNNAYFAQQHLRRLFAQSYGVWEWDGTKYKPVPGSDPLTTDVRSSSFVGWTPPREICPINTAGKPVRDVFPDDYCAIPPSITDDPANPNDGVRFLSGSATTTEITGGSGSVGIKFNTSADPEQVPLAGFTIDWGDSQDSFAYPFAPKNDPAQPHIFSHAYICPGNQTCTYRIKLQVKDNWGWCNDAKKNGSATGMDTVPDTNCQTNPANWRDTGLTVVVKP